MASVLFIYDILKFNILEVLMPAILNNHIETIFDYDLTDEERELLTYGLSEFDYREFNS